MIRLATEQDLPLVGSIYEEILAEEEKRPASFTNWQRGKYPTVEHARAALEAGTLHVFDTATFTVNGETVTTYLADVDDLGDYVGETEAISDGVFLESFYRSAPYFDLDIDGITNLDA